MRGACTLAGSAMYTRASVEVSGQHVRALTSENTTLSCDREGISTEGGSIAAEIYISKPFDCASFIISEQLLNHRYFKKEVLGQYKPYENITCTCTFVLPIHT